MEVAVELRPLEDGDYAPLAQIVQEDEVAKWWGPNDEASLREDTARDDVTGFAILVDGELAGFLTIYEVKDPDFGYAEPDLFIATAQQSKGVGAEALRLALRWAFDRGHTRAIILPRVDNARAIRCYENIGFKPVGVFRRSDRGSDSLALDLLREELT